MQAVASPTCVDRITAVPSPRYGYEALFLHFGAMQCESDQNLKLLAATQAGPYVDAMYEGALQIPCWHEKEVYHL